MPLFLATCSKILEERHKVREELLSKKEPGLEDKRNSQLIKIAKDITVGVHFQETVLWIEIKAIVRNPFSSASEGSKDRSI